MASFWESRGSVESGRGLYSWLVGLLSDEMPSSLRRRATYQAVSSLLWEVAGVVAPHFRVPRACFLVPVVAGVSYHMPAPAHGRAAVAAAVFCPEVGLGAVVAVGAALNAHSCRCTGRTAASAPICPAGRSTHHRIARNLPGRVRSHNTAGRTVHHSLGTVAAVDTVATVAVAAVNVPGRSIAAGAAADSCRIAVAGMPWRRYRTVKPQSCPMLRLVGDEVFAQEGIGSNGDRAVITIQKHTRSM